ncbi:hypothetical protein V6N12_050323 [Hibiscus sabdariffa]|uniref:Uncharacterized protein n=1 Tax=Hibiscus sabdariffa TaxID=183260 RepID=A0ABR2GDT0_9ROSI
MPATASAERVAEARIGVVDCRVKGEGFGLIDLVIEASVVVDDGGGATRLGLMAVGLEHQRRQGGGDWCKCGWRLSLGLGLGFWLMLWAGIVSGSGVLG